ncbi:hypothetical protein IFM89_026384 [Coptis chinensis]|uniref:Uncharacterized protein n=1 Tax=Coptis chinensis TaxID=261450 RepID=A0A835LWN1_9MAGN|nr:hypothetical protein IFM89_026384 [Coptis chinensis]
MKHYLISNGVKALTNPILLPSLFRALFYTTDTSGTTPTLSSKPKFSHGTNLFKRIASLGDQSVSAVPVLEQWVEEGRSVSKDQLTVVIRLDLISKVHGIEKAENGGFHAADEAEEFVRLLGAPDHVSTDNIGRLLDYMYTSNRVAEVSMANEIDKSKRSDNIEETDESENEADLSIA